MSIHLENTELMEALEEHENCGGSETVTSIIESSTDSSSADVEVTTHPLYVTGGELWCEPCGTKIMEVTEDSPEEEEEEEEAEKMSTYEVSYKVISEFVTQVEATSEEEARETLGVSYKFTSEEEGRIEIVDVKNIIYMEGESDE